jgi:hypothetical protein
MHVTETGPALRNLGQSFPLSVNDQHTSDELSVRGPSRHTTLRPRVNVVVAGHGMGGSRDFGDGAVAAMSARSLDESRCREVFYGEDRSFDNVFG